MGLSRNNLNKHFKYMPTPTPTIQLPTFQLRKPIFDRKFQDAGRVRGVILLAGSYVVYLEFIKKKVKLLLIEGSLNVP